MRSVAKVSFPESEWTRGGGQELPLVNCWYAAVQTYREDFWQGKKPLNT